MPLEFRLAANPVMPFDVFERCRAATMLDSVSRYADATSSSTSAPRTEEPSINKLSIRCPWARAQSPVSEGRVLRFRVWGTRARTRGLDFECGHPSSSPPARRRFLALFHSKCIIIPIIIANT